MAAASPAWAPMAVCTSGMRKAAALSWLSTDTTARFGESRFLRMAGSSLRDPTTAPPASGACRRRNFTASGWAASGEGLGNKGEEWSTDKGDAA